MVAIVPVAVSVALRWFGVIASAWLSTAIAVLLSFAAAFAGSLYWRERRGAGELLFSELLLWGWLRLYLEDRKVARASRLLDLEQRRRAASEESLSVAHRQQLLRQLAAALEGQDSYLRGHSRRVARHAAGIAVSLGLPDEEVGRIRAAALIHDVGKLHMPPQILNKPGRLTGAEFELIKLHPTDGARMSMALGDPALTAIVRHHHERLDGSGYPHHLAGDEIPLGARIVAVADTFDAVTSTRTYRRAARHKEAIAILRKDAGSRLDPGAVSAFLGYYSGHRAALIWTISTAMLRRGVSWLTGDPAAAAPIASGKLGATVLATTALGGAVVVAPVVVVLGLSPIVVAAAAAGENPEAVSGLPPAGAIPRGRGLGFGGGGIATRGGVRSASGQTSNLLASSVELPTVTQALGFDSTSSKARLVPLTGGSPADGRTSTSSGADNHSSSTPGGAPAAPPPPGAPATTPSAPVQPQQAAPRHGAGAAGRDNTKLASSGGSGARQRSGGRQGSAGGQSSGRGRGSGGGIAYGRGNGSGNASGQGASPSQSGTTPGQNGSAPG
ncbi:MAG: HD-GYP domain-containing protein, partial [Solirubrobacteraceae bacterium]